MRGVQQNWDMQATGIEEWEDDQQQQGRQGGDYQDEQGGMGMIKNNMNGEHHDIEDYEMTSMEAIECEEKEKYINDISIVNINKNNNNMNEDIDDSEMNEYIDDSDKWSDCLSEMTDQYNDFRQSIVTCINTSIKHKDKYERSSQLIESLNELDRKYENYKKIFMMFNKMNEIL